MDPSLMISLVDLPSLVWRRPETGPLSGINDARQVLVSLRI
jgi:hypothetical protein